MDLTVELASTAYRDIFINYTAGFVFVTLVVIVVNLIRKKPLQKKNNLLRIKQEF